MDLVKKGGVGGGKATAPEGPERKIWVCDLHPEEVFDKPGQCFKGG